MTVAFVVLNAAYVSLLASTFTRTITWLRAMLALASVAFIAFGAIEGILSMVLWNTLIGGMHVYGIARDYRQQQSVKLTGPEQTMRDEFFPGLADFDFHVLWCMGEQVHYSDEVVIQRDSLPDSVSLVLDGTVVIEQSGEITRGLRRGGLVGEMSYVSGLPAEVNVVAHGDVVLREWDQRQLGSLDQLNPASARAFRDLMSRDLVAKARA